MEIQIRTDFAGQINKSNILRQLPRAFKTNANAWAADTIRYIMQKNQGGGGSFMSFKRAPKEIEQNLKHTFTSTGPQSGILTLGTGGYVGKNPVIYARIQDEGGVTHPTVTPKLRRFAWAMFYKTKDDKFKSMALTKKAKLTVTLGARRWFTGPINQRMPELTRTMLPESVWATATAMSNQYKGMGG